MQACDEVLLAAVKVFFYSAEHRANKKLLPAVPVSDPGRRCFGGGILSGLPTK